MEETKTNALSEKGPATPRIPFRARLLLTTFNFFLDTSRRSNGTLNRRLLSLFDVQCRANPTPRRGDSTHDVVLGPSSGLRARLFLPSSPPPSSAGYPLVVYFHGGGFALFSSSSKLYDDFCRRLAREVPLVVVLVNFRRSPEHRFPACYDDGLDALRFLDGAGENAGGSSDVGLESLFRISDLSSCFIAGDSAGGNIAHHVARRWSTEGMVDPSRAPERRLKVVGLIPIQPFFGGEQKTESEILLEGTSMVSEERTDWFWKVFLPEGADKNHPAANVYGPSSKEEEKLGEGFPPVALVIGTADPLMDRQRMYGEGLRERGKEVRVLEYPGAIHGFCLLPELPQSGMLIEDMKGFIQNQSTKEAVGN